MSRPIVVTACMVASSESGHHIGDPGTYVPVEEPSTASLTDICSATKKSLFNHLVGERQQIGRDFDAECFRRLHVYDELELGRLQERQVRWFGALEDLGRVVAVLA